MKKLFYSITVLLTLMFTNQFQGLAQESNHGKQIHARSFLNKKAPKLTFGEWVSDEPDTAGKFILIDFWATWCVPCKRMIPEMNKWHEKYKDQLTIIGLSDEPISKIKEMKIPVIKYYSASDTKRRLKKFVTVRAIPHVILINPEGKVIWEGNPGSRDHPLRTELLDSLLHKYGKTSD